MEEEITISKVEYDALKADKARLDYLDQCMRRLNQATGAKYGWQMIQSHNVNRLLLNWPGDHSVDVQDAQLIGCNPSGHLSVRSAIDKATGYRTGGPGEMDDLVCALLREWWKDWELDGDVARCKSCKRGIIYSNRREKLIHASDCKTFMAYPWALLTALRDPAAE